MLSEISRRQVRRARTARDALSAYITLLEKGHVPSGPIATAAEWAVADACAALAASDSFDEWRQWTADYAGIDPGTGQDLAEIAIAAHETERHRAAHRSAAL